MENLANGETKTRPTLLLTWNADNESVEIKTDGFKGIDMILAVLGMATEHFKFDRNMQRTPMAQAAEMQARQEAQVLQGLARKSR